MRSADGARAGSEPAAIGAAHPPAAFRGILSARRWSGYRPLAVALVVLAIYEIWIGSQLPTSGNGVQFADIGNTYLHLSHASSAISAIHSVNNDPGSGGYDGQFDYFIALDPVNAHAYIDVPAYRYERILYPLLAHVLALGRAALTAYALIAINIAALAGGTLAVAAWLQRRGCSPWYALLFGFSPGLAMGIELDLTEPLAYALVALAVYLFDYGGRWRLPLAALTFALALLARETTVVFALAYAAALLPGNGRGEARTWPGRSNALRAALFAAAAVAPLLAYKLFLLRWLGDAGMPAVLTPTQFPFQGILVYFPWRSFQLDEIRAVVAPGIILGGMALWSFMRGGAHDVAIWSLLVNVLLFVVFLNASSYYSVMNSARIAGGVILAALYALPTLDRLTRGRRLWLWASGALWLSPTWAWVWLPVAVAISDAATHIR